MIELASALTLPIAKLLLKSWLGDIGADIGVGLFQLGLKRLGNRTKARAAQHRAEEIADAVVASLERFFANEHVPKEKLGVVASALGDTIEQHVDAAFLVHQKLNARAIEKALLDARPAGQIYRTAEPEHGWYKRLVKSLAPRLREVAPEVPGYELERDATILERMAEVADKSEQIISKIEVVGSQTAHTEAMVKDLATREDRKRAEYEDSYRKAVLSALDYVEILGLDIDRARREVPLSIAYLSLTTTLPTLGRLEYETLLNHLPAFGNRLMIVGTAGSGKSTLLRWTAVQAAMTKAGNEERALPALPDGLVMRIRDHSIQLAAAQFVDHESPDKTLVDWQNLFTVGKKIFKFDKSLFRELRLRERRLGGNVPKQLIDILTLLYDDTGWRRRMPFLIRLRDIRNGLPRPDDFPAHLTTMIGNPPENWVRDLLRGGDALLLFDGVDEVPEGAARDAALASIEQYVRQYETCQVIVTSRPRTFDKSGLRALQFLEAEVDELTPEQRSSFVESWHRALAIKLGCDKDDRDIMGVASNLEAALERQPKIALLATNPLLCAAICALHERNPGNLPKDEWDLCERLTRMLVEWRDRMHGRNEPIRLSEFGPAYQLPYNDKRSILARIAEAMVSQQLSALPRGEVLDHVARALAEQRSRDDLAADAVLQALEARSGVLRTAAIERVRGESDSPDDQAATDGPAADAVEFAHNTLKAWLASLHCLSLNKPRELADRALASGYPEVVAFAAAAPDHRVYASTLVERLLQNGEASTDKLARRQLVALAMHCDALAPNLPEALRQRLDTLPKRLFPPKNFEEAQQLAVLADSAVPYLAPRRRMPADKAAACVRCLRLIGTERARIAIEAWRDSRETKVIEELADVFHPLSLSAVVDAAQDFDQWRNLPDSLKRKIADLEPIANLTNLQTLFLSNTEVADAAPLARLTNLGTLWLNGTQVADAVALAELTNLQSLDLSGTKVKDAAPLANLTNLRWLYLQDTQVADTAPLARLTKLETLWLSGTRIAGTAALAKLTNLQSLDLSGTLVADAAPLAKLTSLKVLALRGTQIAHAAPLTELTNLRELSLDRTQVTDAAPLAKLTSLKVLALRDTQIADAAPLTELTNLQSLDLSGTKVANAAPLANLTNLQWLSLNDTQLADVAPLANLANLQWLWLNNTQVADAAPLANLANLQLIDLSRTQVADVAPLAKLTNLQSLILYDTQVTPEHVAALKRALAERGNRSLKIHGP